MRGAVLLSYQARWVADENPVAMCVKSRQIGLTWANAAADVRQAARPKQRGGLDCWYLCQSKEETRTYIADCARWAQAYGELAAEFDEEILDPEDHVAIQVHAIKLKSGHSIRALVGHPRNLRGKRGKVTFDEAAYNDHADEFLAAALPFLRWGGMVRIISTEWHTETPFHRWREDIEAGRRDWSIHVVDFDDAIRDGLYRRLCSVRGIPYSEEAERAWRAKEIQDLGEDADRELFCVPIGAHDLYLDRQTVESCMLRDRPVFRFQPPRTGTPFVDWPEEKRESYIDAWLDAEVRPTIETLDETRPHALGADFGRSGDLTVLVPVATLVDLRRSVPFVLELRDTPYDVQERAYRYIIDALPRRGRVALDSGGVGSQLAEAMRQRYGGQVHRIGLGTSRARDPSKRPEGSLMYSEILPPLKSALQRSELDLPADEDHVRDLMGLRRVDGRPRVPTVRSKGKDGGQRHCDYAVGLALGLWAAQTSTASVVPYTPSSIRGNDVPAKSERRKEKLQRARRRGKWTL